MNKSYIFLRFFSNNFKAFLVSFLSANCFERAFTISLSLSIKLFSRRVTVSRSDFKFNESYRSLTHLLKSSLKLINSFSIYAYFSKTCLTTFSSIYAVYGCIVEVLGVVLIELIVRCNISINCFRFSISF